MQTKKSLPVARVAQAAKIFLNVSETFRAAR
jgi:hypothetical protein